MTKLVWAFLSILAGVALGLGLTALSVDQPPNFGVVSVGPWQTRPRIGSAEADPYSKALMATRGEIPMGTAEGLLLSARADSDGQPLTGACSYRLAGTIPAASYWTLAAYRPDGSTGESRGLRGVYTSTDVLQIEGEPLTVLLSPDPQPGNWLPLDPTQAFEVVLRLYETQVSSNAQAIDKASVPAIFRGNCR